MNKKVFNFFHQNYAPGRICLAGSTNLIYELIRLEQFTCSLPIVASAGD